MENRGRPVCPENDELAQYLLQKRQEMADKPKGISENIDKTFNKAYQNLCKAKLPIKTLKELSQIKGFGKWTLTLMQGFFDTEPSVSQPGDQMKKGRSKKGTSHYVPQKNSVPYALLITLYRGTANGKNFMHKQDLIDAAEASGLSRVSIGPEPGKGKQQFGGSARDWYSGWSSMKTLLTKGLVVKSSSPAKYMLTQEGQEVARQCLTRSSLPDNAEIQAVKKRSSNPATYGVLDQVASYPDLESEVTVGPIASLREEQPIDVPVESLEKFMHMGYSKKQVLIAFVEVSKDSDNKNVKALWPAVMCRLREDHVYGSHSEIRVSQENLRATSTSCSSRNGQVEHIGKPIDIDLTFDSGPVGKFVGASSTSFSSRPCSSSRPSLSSSGSNINALRLPPLGLGERFGDSYQVILILDDREQFATRGRKIVECIISEFNIQIEVSRLPVGDCLWIARHKYLQSEYVLDFIVERKKIDDLRQSIRDNRYKDQKLRLLRCGLKKLIYFVEGDPNTCEAAESIKTACFTTEILEGFDIQRTTGLMDTLRKYGFLTKSINEYYKSLVPDEQSKCKGVCPPLDEFIKRCEDLDKITISDVFAIQLMQVGQVTEEVALAVVDLYPTLFSLAQAYSHMGGDICEKEDMLRKQSNNLISGVASRNIFRFVWGD